MVLPIYTFGQPVLRKVAEDITPDYPELKTLIDNMYETLERSEGIGLAAPQIGLSIRLVVINLDLISDDLPEYKGFVHAFINPHILEVGGEEVNMEEGCRNFERLPGTHEVFAILADEYAKSRGFDVKKCLELIEQAHK